MSIRLPFTHLFNTQPPSDLNCSNGILGDQDGHIPLPAYSFYFVLDIEEDVGFSLKHKCWECWNISRFAILLDIKNYDYRKTLLINHTTTTSVIIITKCWNVQYACFFFHNRPLGVRPLFENDLKRRACFWAKRETNRTESPKCNNFFLNVLQFSNYFSKNCQILRQKIGGPPTVPDPWLKTPVF